MQGTSVIVQCVVPDQREWQPHSDSSHIPFSM